MILENMEQHPHFKEFQTYLQEAADSLRFQTQNEVAVESIEYEARSGFIPYTLGGGTVDMIIDMDELDQSSQMFSEAWKTIIDGYVANDYLYNAVTFFKEGGEEVVENNENIKKLVEELDNVVDGTIIENKETRQKAWDAYNRLYEALENTEYGYNVIDRFQEFNLDNQDNAMIRIGYHLDKKEKYSEKPFYLWVSLNFDHPYFRDCAKGLDYVIAENEYKIPETLDEFKAMVDKLILAAFPENSQIMRFDD